MVTVWWFFLFWCYFDLVKLVKFGVFGHFLENPLRKWPEISHADVSWPPSELIDYGYSLLIFLILMLFWLSETGQIWGFQAFWSCSVDFPHYGDPLAEIGHIWGFWALCGERVGVKVRGWWSHIPDALHRVLSSYLIISNQMICLLYDINQFINKYVTLSVMSTFYMDILQSRRHSESWQ